jgi:hypothetical protein
MVVDQIGYQTQTPISAKCSNFCKKRSGFRPTGILLLDLSCSTTVKIFITLHLLGQPTISHSYSLIQHSPYGEDRLSVPLKIHRIRWSMSILILWSEYLTTIFSAEQYFRGDSLNDSNPSSSFWPVPELNTTDGDITLYFLSSSTKYMTPINDPWFLAAQPYVDPERGNQTFYVGEWPVNIIGCINKIQTCIPATGKCTDLASTTTSASQWETALNLSGDLSRQAQIGDRLTWLYQGSLVPALGSGYLLAQEFFNGGLSSALPDNQWIMEFQNFFGIMLAQMQQSLIEFVAGPNDPRFDKYIQPPPANRMWMCTAQVVSRSGYLSFAVFPFALILILGACIIFLNLSIEDLLGCARHKFARISPSSEWRLSSLLQLQRMAFHESGKVEWSQSQVNVPICGSERFIFSEEEEGFLLVDEAPTPSPREDDEITNPVYSVRLETTRWV